MDDPSTYYTPLRMSRPFAPGAPAGGGATPSFRSKTITQTDSATTITATEPASAAQNDILILWVVANIAASSFSGPTGGWTNFYGPQRNGVDSHDCWGFWIRRGAGAPGFTCTFTGGTHTECSVLAYSGCTTSGNPYADLQTTAVANANPENPDPPSVTCTANNRVVALGGAQDGTQTGTWVAPTNYTIREDGTGMSLGNCCASDREIVGAGSENPANFTDGAINTNAIWAVTIALKG